MEFTASFLAHCKSQADLLDAAVEQIVGLKATRKIRREFRTQVVELVSCHYPVRTESTPYAYFRNLMRTVQKQSTRLRVNLVELSSMLTTHQHLFFKPLRASPSQHALAKADFWGHELRASRSEVDGWKVEVGGDNNGRLKGDDWWRDNVVLHMNDSPTVQALRWTEEFCQLFLEEHKGRGGGPWTLEREFAGHPKMRLVVDAGIMLLNYDAGLLTAKKSPFQVFCSLLYQFVSGETPTRSSAGMNRYIHYAVPLLRRLWSVCPPGAARTVEQINEAQEIHQQLQQGPSAKPARRTSPKRSRIRTPRPKPRRSRDS